MVRSRQSYFDYVKLALKYTFYKNIFYRHIEAEMCEFKNTLRIKQGLTFGKEYNFAIEN